MATPSDMGVLAKAITRTATKDSLSKSFLIYPFTGLVKVLKLLRLSRSSELAGV